MNSGTGRRNAVSNIVASVAVVLLFIIAAGGYLLYFATVSSPARSLTTVSFTTVTATVNSTILITGAGGKIITVTKTVAGNSTGFAVNGTLIIIPNGVASNQALDFTPSAVKVVIGVNNTVTWLNQDKLSQHTIVTQSAPSGATYWGIVLQTGQTYSETLTVPGTYNYYCMWHPGWMRASIIVANK